MPLNDGQRFVFKAIKSQRIKADTFARYLFACQFVADRVVLDAACGIGFGSFFLAQEAHEVWGVDYLEEAVEYAKQNYSRHNIKFLCSELLNFEFPENFFDVIISFHTLEQTNKPDKLLDNFKGALRPGGLLILSAPNKKIVSPFKKEPIGKFNKFEFYKKDLECLLASKFKVEWYGQRITSKLMANYFVRRFMRLLEILLNKKFGFYGVRESYEIKPLRFWHEPKDFVVILTKK